MDDLDKLLQDLTDNLDKRRFEFTRFRRLVFAQANSSLEPTAVRMGIPMIYAEWEGYVREVCQLYLEYIETTVKSSKELTPALLGYMWTPILKPITGGLNHDRKTRVVQAVVASLEEAAVFKDSEKTVDTASNLRFQVLESIAASLCLNIASLAPWKSHLNALVDLRNNIAHGSRPTTLMVVDFDRLATNTIGLMEEFEKVVIFSLHTRSFCGQAA